MRKALQLASVAAAAILFGFAAFIWFGSRDAIPHCAVPEGVSVTSRLNDAPLALVRALTKRVGEIVPAGAKFDATDLEETGKNRRLIFIWTLGSRWVVATEHGGRGYNNPIFGFDVRQDGGEAIFVQERTVSPDSVCLTATSLLDFGRPRGQDGAG